MRQFHQLVKRHTLRAYRTCGTELLVQIDLENASVGANANKVMVQGIYDALDRGERTVFLDALHEDLVMQVMGSSSWSQTVHGKRNFLDVFFGHLASRLSSQSEHANSLSC